MTCDALFPCLLGDDWVALAEPVRLMHGDVPSLRARGEADVDGAANLFASLLRRILGLPSPGMRQNLELTIERAGMREVWTRHFSGSQMRSVLSPSGTRLREQLGPIAFYFDLRRAGDAIDWRLCSAKLLGLPLPRFLCGQVMSRSGSEQGRYTFDIDTRLPLIGRLVSYRGWLEIVDD